MPRTIRTKINTMKMKKKKRILKISDILNVKKREKKYL